MNFPAQEMQQENKICFLPMQLHGVARVWYYVHGLCKGPGSFLKREVVFVQLRKSLSPEKKFLSPQSVHRYVGLASCNKKNYLD